MRFVYNDGGREAAGFIGRAGDCVARAIAIAGELDYRYVYYALADGAASERKTKRGGRVSGRRSARNGINVTRKWFKDWMAAHGFQWAPTMRIGQGCKVHLVDGELPMGRLVVSVSKHYTAVIDGVIHDTHDPQRRTIWFERGVTDSRDAKPARLSERCVYGYWVKA